MKDNREKEPEIKVKSVKKALDVLNCFIKKQPLGVTEFSNLSLTAKNVIPTTAQCTVFAESEVITLVGEGKPTDEIAAGIEMAVAKRCFVMA